MAGETFSARKFSVYMIVYYHRLVVVMVTNLERFKERMEPARQLYSHEIRDFAKKFDALGEMTMSEFPDIDVQEYIFDFKKVNGTSEEELDRIYSEISDHMDKFSKAHGIEKFCRYACIWI